MFLIFLLHALFALTFPIAKIAVKNSDPIFFTAVRMFISGLLLILYQYFLDYKNNIKKSYINDLIKYKYYILGLAIFNIFLTNVPEYWALKYLSSANASFIYSISPFISAIISYFLFNEKIGFKKFIGMLIGFLGFILMLFKNDVIAEVSYSKIKFLSWSEIAMIFAAFSSVYGWIIMKQIINKKFSLFMANGYSMILGSLLSFISYYIFSNSLEKPITNLNNFIISLISLILLSNIICYNFYSYLLKKYTATLISFVGFIEPFFAAFYGWLFMGERVSIIFFISSFIVFIGLYIFYSQELKQGYIKH